MTHVEQAYAKVNLYLHVCGKRDDGYHLLDSLVVFAQYGDVLTFEESETLSLEVRGAQKDVLKETAFEDNLIIKAARGLQSLCQITKGAKITLEKNLPVAAGIGGGSGDAAATLKGLCALWKVFPEPEGLERLSLKLGADVPVCMKSHANHLSGIGDCLTPLPPLPDCWMVLVNPLIGVSTPEVFKLRNTPFKEMQAMGGEYSYDQFITALKERGNDLFEPAKKIVPSLTEILSVIEGQQGCSLVRMSGSGATCFGLFQSESEAKSAFSTLQMEYPQWWSACGKII